MGKISGLLLIDHFEYAGREKLLNFFKDVI